MIKVVLERIPSEYAAHNEWILVLRAMVDSHASHLPDHSEEQLAMLGCQNEQALGELTKVVDKLQLPLTSPLYSAITTILSNFEPSSTKSAVS